MKTTRVFRRFRRVERRANRRLAVEPLEDRLVLSPTLPLPPPAHVDAVVSFHPPNPCISQAASFHPPQPCISQVAGFHPPSPCIS